MIGLGERRVGTAEFLDWHLACGVDAGQACCGDSGGSEPGIVISSSVSAFAGRLANPWWSLRKLAGMTQRQLTAALKREQNLVACIEQGQRFQGDQAKERNNKTA